MIKIFKILDSATGLFSSGGMRPTFSKNGKTWSAKNAIKNHLTLYRTLGCYNHNRSFPESWVVIEVTIDVNSKESWFNEMSVKDFYEN